jgi:hypothetical protein
MTFISETWDCLDGNVDAPELAAQLAVDLEEDLLDHARHLLRIADRPQVDHLVTEKIRFLYTKVWWQWHATTLFDLFLH